MTVLGLDIGTTGAKAAAFDEEGHRLAAADCEYPLLHPRPGWYELDPARVAAAIREVIGRTAAEVGRGRIRALACSALGEAVLPVDASGHPLYNTLLALDHRAAAQAQALRERIDPQEFFEVTGQSLHPIASLFKILWWKDEHPELYAAADRFLCWNDMVAVMLGLDPAISPSLAARTGLYDPASGGWSQRMLALAALEPGRLARVVPAGEPVGTVASAAAEELGLAPQCLYVSGGWDQVCAALGGGAVEEGTAVNFLGSTDSLNATYRALRLSAPMLEHRFTCTPSAVPGCFTTNAFSLNGGNLLNWFRDCLDRERAADWANRGGSYFERMIAEAMEGRHPPLVLAHFAGSGTPYMDPGSLGSVVGLSLATERRDIALGILEGIAMEMAVNLRCLREAQIPVLRIHAGGGGARNRRLLQLRSDVFGMPLMPLLEEEGGCTGAAMLALAGAQGGADLEGLGRTWVRYGDTVEPDPERSAHYASRIELYARLYPLLREINAAQAAGFAARNEGNETVSRAG